MMSHQTHSWASLVHHITRIDPSDTPGSSIVYLLWKDGQVSKHMLSIVIRKCPLKLLEYYRAYHRYKLKKVYKTIPFDILELDSWEELVLKICNVMDDRVLVQWLDDSLSFHDVQTVEDKCPTKLINYFEWFSSTSEAAQVFSQGNRAPNKFELVMESDELTLDTEPDDIEKLLGLDQEKEVTPVVMKATSPSTARKKSIAVDQSKPPSSKQERFGRLEKYLGTIASTPKKPEKKIPVFDSTTRAVKAMPPRSGAMSKRRAPKSEQIPQDIIIIGDDEPNKKTEQNGFMDLSKTESKGISGAEKYTMNALEQSPMVSDEPKKQSTLVDVEMEPPMVKDSKQVSDSPQQEDVKTPHKTSQPNDTSPQPTEQTPKSPSLVLEYAESPNLDTNLVTSNESVVFDSPVIRRISRKAIPLVDSPILSSNSPADVANNSKSNGPVGSQKTDESPVNTEKLPKSTESKPRGRNRLTARKTLGSKPPNRMLLIRQRQVEKAQKQIEIETITIEDSHPLIPEPASVPSPLTLPTHTFVSPVLDTTPTIPTDQASEPDMMEIDSNTLPPTLTTSTSTQSIESRIQSMLSKLTTPLPKVSKKIKVDDIEQKIKNLVNAAIE